MSFRNSALLGMAPKRLVFKIISSFLSLVLFFSTFAASFLGSGAPAMAETGNWKSNGPYGSDVPLVTVSPDFATDKTVFIGRYGVYKSTDGGANWRSASNGLGGAYVWDLAISPSFAVDHVIFAGTDNGIYKTTDGGENWSKVDVAVSGDRRIRHLAISPNYTVDTTLFMLAVDGSVYKSTDGGLSWSNTAKTGLEGQNALIYLVVSPDYASDKTLFVASSQALYKSTDGGESWNLAGNHNDTYASCLVISPSFAEDETLLMGSNDGLYKSNDGGASWKKSGSGLSSTQVQSIAFSPDFTTDKTLYLGTYGTGVYKSVDGGANWTASNNKLGNLKVLSVALVPNFATDKTVFAGTLQGAYASTDGGASWSAMQSGADGKSINCFSIPHGFSDEKSVFAGSYDGVYKSSDGGASWSTSSIFLEGKWIRKIFLSPNSQCDNTFFAIDGATGKLYKSLDGGASWKAPYFSLGNDGVSALAFSPNFVTDRTLFAGTASGVFKSTDGGENWWDMTCAIYAGYSGQEGFAINSIAISPNFSTDKTLFAGTEFGVFKSTDGGESWHVVNSNIKFVYSLSLSPRYSFDRTVFAVPSRPDTFGGIYKSTDGGASWSAANNSLDSLHVNSLCLSPNFATDKVLFVGTDHGVYESTDAGVSWSPVGKGIENQNVSALALPDDFSKSKILFACTGDGVYSYSFSDTGSSSRGAISGTVKDTNGLALSADAYVTVNALQMTSNGLQQVASVEPYLDGSYSLSLTPGEYVIQFEAHYGSYLSEYFDDARSSDDAAHVILSSGEEKTGIDGQLEQGSTIRGRVTDTAGEPIKDISVSVWDGTGEYFGYVMTDENGDYAVQDLVPGDYLVQFESLGGAYVSEYYNNARMEKLATSINLSSGDERNGIDAELEKSGRILGKVTDAKGAPIEGVLVSAVSGGLRENATTDVNGDYAIQSLASGQYKVFFDPKYVNEDNNTNYIAKYFDNKDSDESATLVSVTQGWNTRGISASLAIGGRITGSVIDTQGKPLTNAKVDAYDSAEGEPKEVFATAYTDENGMYKMPGLSASRKYKVVFSKQSQAETPASSYLSEWFNGSPTFSGAMPVEITAGKSTDGVSAELMSGGASMTGVITDGQGGGVDRAVVIIYDLNRQPVASVYTGEDGRYEVDGLAAGTYKMRVDTSLCNKEIDRPLVSEWYHDKTDFDSAITLQLDTGKALTGIDEQLSDVDTIAPTVPEDVKATRSENSVSLTWAASADNVGVAGYSVEKSTDQSTWNELTSVSTTTASDTPPANVREYYRVRAFDASGNYSGHSNTTNAIIDTQAPAAPVNLSENPGGWKNTPTFTIDWTNPEDSTGIVGCYYKLGSAPTSATDGTYTTAKPFTASATAENQPLYVWLKDGAANTSEKNRASLALKYDATAPTAGTVAVNNGAAYVTIPSVTLNSLSATDTVSGVVGMRFSNNGSTWSAEEAYTASKIGWSLSSYGGSPTAGAKTVYVQFKDSAGNWSGSFSDSINFDPSPPTVPSNLAVARAGNDLKLSWNVSIDDLGVAGYKVEESTDQVKWSELPSVSTTTATSTPPANVREYYRVRAFDAAGNYSGYSNVANAIVDTQAPGAPVGLIATPFSWTNNPTFTIGWTNPEDPTGIAGCYYKLGSAPANATDGTYATAESFSVSAMGENQPIYVWLKDGSGNVNSTNCASVTLKYDKTPPTNGTIVINNGDSNMKSFIVSLDTLLATDTVSGVSAMRFSNNGSTWSAEETYTASKTGWSLISYGGSATAGLKTVYVQFKDRAGNWSESFSDSISYDPVPPTVPSNLAVARAGNDLKLSWNASFDNLGVVGYKVEESTDQTIWSELPSVSTTTATSTPPANVREYYRVCAFDAAGNYSGYSKVASAIIDTLAPGVPTNLSAAPFSWTNYPNFIIYCINQKDPSGIAGCYYKLGSAPTNATDGTFAMSEPFDVSATEENQPLYVWLKDGAGNANYENWASVTLKYDITPPINGAIAINNGDSNTRSLVVSLDSLSSTDTLSGVSAMRFSNNGSTWSHEENYAPCKTDWDLSAYGGNASPGAKTVYVQFKDAAGNWSQSFFDSIIFDPLAPTVPTRLAVARNGSGLRLTWTASTDEIGVSSYAVERKSEQEDWKVIGSSTSASYTDVSPQPNVRYYYRVHAEDGAGNASGYSNTSSGIVDMLAPTDPTGLRVTRVGGSIALSWNASVDKVGVSYKIERRVKGQTNWKPIAGSATPTFTDAAVGSETVYYYRVRAYDGAGNPSGYSNVTSIKSLKQATVAKEETAPYLKWTGTWSTTKNPSYSGGSAKYIKANGALEIPFRGTSITWIGAMAANRGIAEVYIDGKLIKAVDQYAKTTAFKQTVFSKAGLSDTAHTLKIKATGMKNKDAKDTITEIDAITINGYAPGVSQEESAVSRWKGTWSETTATAYSAGKTNTAKAKNANAEYTFTGTSVTWIGTKASNHGIADVFIDNVFQGSVDSYTQGTAYQQVIYTKSGLKNTKHTIKIVVTNTKQKAASGSAIDVDGFVVR